MINKKFFKKYFVWETDNLKKLHKTSLSKPVLNAAPNLIFHRMYHDNVSWD